VIEPCLYEKKNKPEVSLQKSQLQEKACVLALAPWALKK
jgi:hypothetical protein